MATEAVKLLTGVGQTLLGRVLVVDTLTWSWRNFRLSPDPSRPPVTRIESAPSEQMGDDDPLPTISAAELASRLRARDAGENDTGESNFLLVDVRQPAEHALDAIPGSLLVPLGTLATADLPLDQPIILHCARGARSAQALRLLRDRGYTQISHLDGGIAAWNAATVSPSYPRGQAFSPERVQGLP
jgi:adenylyltransferase/sulfurtransferase